MTETNADAVLTVTRTFRADAQCVYDAWLIPERRMKWWCARDGMYCDFCEIDARVGGRYRLNMKSPKSYGPDAEYIANGEFLELDPPTRIRFTWSWEHDKPVAVAAANTIVTIDLSEADGVTTMTLTHEGFATAEACDEHTVGWGGSLDRLEQFVQQQ